MKVFSTVVRTLSYSSFIILVRFRYTRLNFFCTIQGKVVQFKLENVHKIGKIYTEMMSCTQKYQNVHNFQKKCTFDFVHEKGILYVAILNLYTKTRQMQKKN